MKKIIILIICILALTACVQTTTEEPIKIGAILGLSGNDYAVFGHAMLEGIEIAKEEINAEGGINGKPIKLIVEDDQFLNYKATVTAANKLTAIDGVDATLIGVTNDGKPAAPIFNDAETPLVIMWDDSEEFKHLGEYVFGIGYSVEKGAYLMAEYAYEKGIRTVAIFQQQDEWSLLIGNSFAEKFEELGGEIVFQEKTVFGDRDFKTAIAKAMAKNPDGIYAPLVDGLDTFAIQLKQMDYKGVLMSGDIVTEQVITNSKGAVEGIYHTNGYIPESEKTQRLTAKYKEKYGKDPDLLLFNAMGYDGLHIIADQMEKQGSLKENLRTVEGWEGVGGVVSMNEWGSASKQQKLFVVKNGQSVLIG